MAGRVTIQDIADALGLSRNTVSKAINNTGVLADATREKILQKAVEMGYKQFTYLNSEDLTHSSAPASSGVPFGEIAVITCTQLGNSHFSSTMLDKFQREMTQLGYTITMHRVSPEEQQNLRLPNSFHKDTTLGILCIETFNYTYTQMICDLQIPVLFVDHPVLCGRSLPADRLLMNNSDEIFTFVAEMKRRGKTRIGYVGDYLHCQSFFERYMAFRNAMYVQGLPLNKDYCIIGTEQYPASTGYPDYPSYLYDCIHSLQQLPDVLICANDFIAIDVLQVLRKLHISVPNDIFLCGFDDSPESRVVTPPLTSIHIHGEILGLAAVELLLSRMKDPSLNYRTVYAETNLVYRESTND